MTLTHVPSGGWAVGVSGGADSVALLALLQNRSDLQVHIVHLNHQTRGGDSDDDEAFVRNLAKNAGLPCTVGRMSELPAVDLANPSARFRAARFELFSKVVTANQLAGVILAHHGDDQIETILLRILRGSGPLGLEGIRCESRIKGLRVIHPLLATTRKALRDFLTDHGMTWREDISNTSPRYLRNRLRRLLEKHHMFHDPIAQLGVACREWREWLDSAAPRLPTSFPVMMLQNLPTPVALHAIRIWFREQGVSSDLITTASTQRLLTMATDAASPARLNFPGGLLLQRKQGFISNKTSGVLTV